MEAPAPAAEEAPPVEARQTAMEALGLDPAQPWQEAVEPLRQAFLEQSPVQDAPDDRYVYVSLPMPAEAGASEMLAGIRAEDGVPAAASYAIPAPWSAEPPAGLEDYAWSGDQNGGWWVAEMDVRTGTRL